MAFPYNCSIIIHFIQTRTNENQYLNNVKRNIMGSILLMTTRIVLLVTFITKYVKIILTYTRKKILRFEPIPIIKRKCWFVLRLYEKKQKFNMHNREREMFFFQHYTKIHEQYFFKLASAWLPAQAPTNQKPCWKIFVNYHGFS